MRSGRRSAGPQEAIWVAKKLVLGSRNIYLSSKGVGVGLEGEEGGGLPRKIM